MDKVDVASQAELLKGWSCALIDKTLKGNVPQGTLNDLLLLDGHGLDAKVGQHRSGKVPVVKLLCLKVFLQGRIEGGTFCLRIKLYPCWSG